MPGLGHSVTIPRADVRHLSPETDVPTRWLICHLDFFRTKRCESRTTIRRNISKHAPKRVIVDKSFGAGSVVVKAATVAFGVWLPLKKRFVIRSLSENRVFVFGYVLCHLWRLDR